MTKGDKEKYRVEAAIAAMQAMLTNPRFTAAGAGDEDVSRWAVTQADALMKELGLDKE